MHNYHLFLTCLVWLYKACVLDRYTLRLYCIKNKGSNVIKPFCDYPNSTIKQEKYEHFLTYNKKCPHREHTYSENKMCVRTVCKTYRDVLLTHNPQINPHSRLDTQGFPHIKRVYSIYRHTYVVPTGSLYICLQYQTTY